MLAGVLVLLVLPAGASANEVHDLGPVPSSQGVGNYWYAVNDSDQVGGSGNLDTAGNTAAVRWEAGTVTQLGSVHQRPSGGTTISNDGTVRGYVVEETSPGSGAFAKYPAVWRGGSDEQVLTAYPGGEAGGFQAASANGTAIFQDEDNPGAQEAVTSPKGEVSLIPGSAQPGSGGVSNSGHAVVSDSMGRAFWDGSSLHQLQVTATGGRQLNNLDQVTGTTSASTGSQVAAVEQEPAGTLRRLQELPGAPAGDFKPVAINDTGVVVGSTGSGAAISTPDGNTQLLDTLLPPGSGWHLTSAADINARGDVLGTGTLDGQSHTFLLTVACGSGASQIKLNSAVPARPGPFGPHPGTSVTLAGQGFCPGMKVSFGNDQAQVTAAAADITGDGKSATVTIPPLATTGNLTVTQAAVKVTLASVFAIDSYRNTLGFRFANGTGYTSGTYDDLTAAYGAEVTYKHQLDTACPPANCPVTVLAPDPILLDLYRNVLHPSQAIGLCFGFALSSAEFANGILSPSAYKAGAANAFALPRSRLVLNTLSSRYLVQFSDALRNIERSQQENSARDANTLRGELASPSRSGLGPIVGIRTSTPLMANGRPVLDANLHPVMQTSGHALLSTGVEDDAAHPGGFFINVIDSNLPYDASAQGEEAQNGTVHASRVGASRIIVDRSGHWSYPPLGLSGPISRITTTPLNALEPPQTLFRFYPAKPQAYLDASIGSGAELSALAAGDGRALTVDGPGSQVVSTPTISGPTTTPDASFMAPTGSYTTSLFSTAASIEQTWTTRGSLARASGHAQQARISYDPARMRIGYAPVVQPRPGITQLTLISEPAHGAARTMVLDSSSTRSAVSAAFNRSRNRIIVTSTKLTTIKLLLTQTRGPSALSPQRVTPFKLPGGASATIDPATWSARAVPAVDITIKPRRGRARRLHLKSHTPVSRFGGYITLTHRHRTAHAYEISARLNTPRLPAGSTETVAAVFAGPHHRPYALTVLKGQLAVRGARTLRFTTRGTAKRTQVRVVVMTVRGDTGLLAQRTTTIKP